MLVLASTRKQPLDECRLPHCCTVPAAHVQQDSQQLHLVTILMNNNSRQAEGRSLRHVQTVHWLVKEALCHRYGMPTGASAAQHCEANTITDSIRPAPDINHWCHGG